MLDEDTLEDAPQRGIKCLAKDALKVREIKKSSFMMNFREFIYHIRKKVQPSRLGEAYVLGLRNAYDVVVRAFEAWEESHEDYAVLVDEAIIDAESDDIEETLQLYSDAQVLFEMEMKEEGYYCEDTFAEALREASRIRLK